MQTGPTTLLGSNATPLDFFILIFDDDMLQLIVDQINLYAAQNPPSGRYPWVDTSVPISGYNNRTSGSPD